MGTTRAGQKAQPTLIGSVRRALRLLEAVAARPDGAPAKQLARDVGLPLPTTYHLLRTLTYEGYLRRDNGLFVFGPAAAALLGDGGSGGTAGSESGGGGRGSRERPGIDLADQLAALRDEAGAAVYFGIYHEGEIAVPACVDGPDAPVVEEWADFRDTAHAHAIGQCLLAHLDDERRRDHLARHPVRTLTAYTVRDEAEFLRRLALHQAGEPVYEYQQYALGTVCSAVPVTVGSQVACVAVSLPFRQANQLRSVTHRLRSRIEQHLMSLAFSISI